MQHELITTQINSHAKFGNNQPITLAYIHCVLWMIAKLDIPDTQTGLNFFADSYSQRSEKLTQKKFQLDPKKSPLGPIATYVHRRSISGHMKT